MFPVTPEPAPLLATGQPTLLFPCRFSVTSMIGWAACPGLAAW